jgi:hypothetical protein
LISKSSIPSERGQDQTDNWRVWLRNDQVVTEQVLAGQETEPVLTAYGDNDLVLSFLFRSGFWPILTGMSADRLRKHNGYDPAILNGVEVVRELAGIERIQQCGKVIHDTRLMMQTGFNLEHLTRKVQRQRGAIDCDTLANHLARISPASAQTTFVEQVRHLRRKRWIRGTVYAADAHEIIIPYGRRHEQMGQVGEKHGFKLVIVINVSEDQERIVGFKLAPLETSERAMLAEILVALDRAVAPLRQWLKILLLDRGYWGAEYLLGLKAKYGIDLVTRIQHDGLQAVEWIEMALAEASWQEHDEERSRLGKIRVKVAGVEHVPLYCDGDHLVGQINATVADEYDQQGQRLRDEAGNVRPRFYYATTLPLLDQPYGIRALYLKRWLVENQGFRNLTQRWHIDTLVSRKFAANVARLAFVFMLYNAERCLRWKYQERWAEEKKRLAEWGEAGLMGGLAVVVYTLNGQLGLYSVPQYRDLIQRAERRQVVRYVRAGLERGRSTCDLLEELDT